MGEQCFRRRRPMRSFLVTDIGDRSSCPFQASHHDTFASRLLRRTEREREGRSFSSSEIQKFTSIDESEKTGAYAWNFFHGVDVIFHSKTNPIAMTFCRPLSGEKIRPRVWAVDDSSALNRAFQFANSIPFALPNNCMHVRIPLSKCEELDF